MRRDPIRAHARHASARSCSTPRASFLCAPPLAEALRRPGRLEWEVPLALPTCAERQQALQACCSQMALAPDVDLAQVATPMRSQPNVVRGDEAFPRAKGCMRSPETATS